MLQIALRFMNAFTRSSPVFAPNAELRDALNEWSRAIDALQSDPVSLRLSGCTESDRIHHAALSDRADAARLRCEQLLKFNPRCAFE